MIERYNVFHGNLVILCAVIVVGIFVCAWIVIRSFAGNGKSFLPGFLSFLSLIVVFAGVSTVWYKNVYADNMNEKQIAIARVDEKIATWVAGRYGGHWVYSLTVDQEGLVYKVDASKSAFEGTSENTYIAVEYTSKDGIVLSRDFKETLPTKRHECVVVAVGDVSVTVRDIADKEYSVLTDKVLEMGDVVHIALVETPDGERIYLED